jgi:ABC-2 type transport system permease protein
MAPGLFAFAAIFLIMIVAQSFVDERQTGVLRRINITPTTPAEFLGSRAISNMLMAIIQAALVFLTAFLIGFHAKGDIVNIIAAFIVVSIFSLCCIGFGLITAALAKSSGAATGLSFIFILPLMFLGTYVTTGLAAAQAISQFVPSYYATDALTSLLLRGAPVTSPIILIDMAILSAYSIAVLLIGVLLFRKYGRT